MPDYLFTAKTSNGRKVTERAEAASANEVVQLLRDRGFTDIVLHTDDVGALYTRHRDVERVITPKEYVSFRQRRGYFGRILFLARKLSLSYMTLLLLAAVALASRRWLGVPWTIWDFAVLAALPVPLVWIMVAPLFNPVHRYDRLI